MARASSARCQGNDFGANGMSDLIRGPWPALTSLDMTDSWAVSHKASCIDFTEADAPVLASLFLGTDYECDWPACLPISSCMLPCLARLDVHGTVLRPIPKLAEGGWPLLAQINPKNTVYSTPVLAQGRWLQLVELQLPGHSADGFAMLDQADFPSLTRLEFDGCYQFFTLTA